MAYIKSVDIRGNNDRSWTKGLEWLLKYYMPGQDKEKTHQHRFDKTIYFPQRLSEKTPL